MEKRQSDFIDLRALFEDYRAHWYWFLISLIICCGAAFVFIKARNVQYAVRANVLITTEDKASALLDISSMLGGGDATVDNEVFVMSAHSLYKDVAKDLGLDKIHVVYPSFLSKRIEYEKYPIDVIAPERFVDTTSVILTFKINVSDEGAVDALVKYPAEREILADIEDARFPVKVATRFGEFMIDSTQYYVPGESVKSLITVRSYDSAAEDMDEDIFVGIADKNSDVLTLALDIDNPAFGKKILDDIVARYNLRCVAEKRQEGVKTIDFLDRRIALLAAALDSTEIDIQQYKESIGVVDVASEAAYNYQKKNSLHNQAFQEATALEILCLTRDFLKDSDNEFSLIPYSTDIPQVSSAVDAYNKLILERMTLSTAAKGENVALRQLDNSILALKENILSTLDKTISNASVSLGEVKGEMGRAESKLSNVPGQERSFRGKNRQQQLTQHLYLYLLQRREETAIMIANALPKGVIVDEAFTLQKPVSASKWLIMALALIMGLILPPVILYVRKLFRTKFSTTEELASLTRVPILGEVCSDKSGRQLVVTSSSTTSTAELFRLIRSNLQFVMSNPDDKVVLITSTSSGEGKSFISINLAASLALLGKKVVLVGMDIRNPRLGDYLHIAARKGLTQYLSDFSMEPSDIINPYSDVKGLDIILAGPIPPNPSELLQSQRMDSLVDYLRANYDYILLDTAPVGMVSDTFSLARLGDATVYVTRANRTSISDLRYLNDIVDNKRLKRVSIVLNGTATRKGYGYGYGRDKH